MSLREVTKAFQSPARSYVAVDGVSLDVQRGYFVSLVGPSGCGKSTLLNIVAGLTQATSGTVSIFGKPLQGINRHASYMFQQDALLPWKTVFDNVRLGLQLHGVDRARQDALARDWIIRVGLSGFEGAYPFQLSGGMRKRVAMAQSWIVDPDLVLMDEPFSALDIHTRQRMENEILDLWAGSGKTILFITHDLEEAIALSDEVAVLSAGPGSHIVARHRVDLPRPRNLLDLRTDALFIELFRIIWSDLRSQVLRSYERKPE